METPATERQLNFMLDNRIPFKEGVTKTQAWELIKKYCDENKRKQASQPPTEKQIELAKRLCIDFDEGTTCEDARKIISDTILKRKFAQFVRKEKKRARYKI